MKDIFNNIPVKLLAVGLLTVIALPAFCPAVEALIPSRQNWRSPHVPGFMTPPSVQQSQLFSQQNWNDGYSGTADRRNTYGTGLQPNTMRRSRSMMSDVGGGGGFPPPPPRQPMRSQQRMMDPRQHARGGATYFDQPPPGMDSRFSNNRRNDMMGPYDMEFRNGMMGPRSMDRNGMMNHNGMMMDRQDMNQDSMMGRQNMDRNSMRDPRDMNRYGMMDRREMNRNPTRMDPRFMNQNSMMGRSDMNRNGMIDRREMDRFGMRDHRDMNRNAMMDPREMERNRMMDPRGMNRNGMMDRHEMDRNRMMDRHEMDRNGGRQPFRASSSHFGQSFRPRDERKGGFQDSVRDIHFQRHEQQRRREEEMMFGPPPPQDMRGMRDEQPMPRDQRNQMRDPVAFGRYDFGQPPQQRVGPPNDYMRGPSSIGMGVNSEYGRGEYFRGQYDDRMMDPGMSHRWNDYGRMPSRTVRPNGFGP